MAKFHSYFVLCPLIDQNSFLGVNKDKEQENVVVTLGRNVVNKYRLSDQKQIGGWTSRDHITSAVIYDHEQQSYIGVFNKNTIKAWKGEEESLDKLKKYKFSANILKVVPRQNQTSLIIFENGNCASLPYGVENKNSYDNKLILKDSESIVDVETYTIENKDYICYILKNKGKKEKCEILACPVREELGDLEKAELKREKVSRSDDVHIAGHLISNTNSTIYFLWSDSKMSIYDLRSKAWKNMVTIPWMSTFPSVSLAWMGQNHLILFGSNTDQDGAIFVAYNVVLGVGSCKYPMKLYTKDAKLYCFDNRIILQGSNHIAMVPYTLETERNLSSLLGSHETPDTVTEISNWGKPAKPNLINGKLKHLWRKGLSERNLCAQIIPTLMEKDDLNAITQTLAEFADIPESVIVSLLIYVVKSIDSDFDITNEEEIRAVFSCEEDLQKFGLIKHLLLMPFSDALIMPHLRNGLTLNDALLLLTYISYLLTDSELDIPSESKLYDWCILLMDTFYQQYLMTKDPKITYVLNNVQELVNSLISNLNTIDKVMPLLDKMLHGTPIPEQKSPSSYAIELLNI